MENLENQTSNESIGRRIAQLRKNYNWTQAFLADQLGITAKHVSEIERGVTGISIDIQVTLSELFNISLDYLIKGESYKSVEYFLPKYIVDILNKDDEAHIELLKDYLNLFERIDTHKD